MKHLIKRLSTSDQDILGCLSFGSYYLSVVTKKGKISSLLNGYEVLNSPFNDKKAMDFLSAFSTMVNVLMRKSSVQSIDLYKSEWENKKHASKGILEKVTNSLENTVGKDRFKVKNVPQNKRELKVDVAPYFSVNKSLDYPGLCKNLFLLNTKIKKICIGFNDLIYQGNILSRRKLIGTMWGAKDIQKVLDKINSEIQEEMPSWEKIDFYKEMLEKTINRLSHKLCNNTMDSSLEEKKIVSSILIPDVIKYYENIKNNLISLSVVFGPFVYIDDIFKKYSNYPANWFFSDETTDKLQEDYEQVLSFLSLAPVIEANVIDPLDFLRIQLLNI